MTRHEIQVLRGVGMPQGAVAAKTGVSVDSVRRIEREASVDTGETAALIHTRRVGRPSAVSSWATQIATWLSDDRRLPGMEVLHRARAAGYRGGKSALYELLRRLRPVPSVPVVRFEGVPGEFSQHDFGEVIVRYVAGTTERLRFFASRLKWSRFAHVVVVPDQRVEALVLRGLDAFGGVPLVTVWDKPKTVVLERRGDRIVWNPVFGQGALDYRFAPELCWPRSGQHKGAVENLVGWVKGSFFKCRRFHDRADVDRQLAEWLDEGNTRRPNRATGEIPARRLIHERARLRSLPIPATAYALTIPVVVGAQARVRCDGGDYSVSPEAIGQAATVHLYEDRLEIVLKTGAVIAHPRGRGLHIAPSHRTAILEQVRGRRGRLYFQRQSLWELGADAETWLTELVHRRPAAWRQDVEACFTLLQDYGPEPLNAAFARDVRHGVIGAEYVRTHFARVAVGA
jgi:transposase